VGHSLSANQNKSELQFAVDRWAAVATGLSTPDEWLDWFRRPTPLAREFSPNLPWMSSALKRRVSPVGRAALAVLAACQPENVLCPIVLASRYGDLAATAQLLTQLHQEGLVSPMGFSLAVHNAALGIYSIARQDRTSTTSIAAKTDLVESAFFEALGWMACGATEVVVVCCGDHVPPPYSPESEAHHFRHAWACRLRPVPSGGINLRAANDATPEANAWSKVESPSLRALAFLVAGHESVMPSETGRYQWRRNDRLA